MSKNVKQNLALAGGTLGFFALVAFMGIANYGGNGYDARAMDNVRDYMLPDAQREYQDAHERAVQAGFDTLAKDAKYAELKYRAQKTADSLNRAASYEEYKKLYDQYKQQTAAAEARAEELFNAKVSEDSALFVATQKMQERQARLTQMQRDSAVFAQKRASQTFAERMNDNFDEFKRDYNNARIKFHQKRLQELQKFKQERSR